MMIDSGLAKARLNGTGLDDNDERCRRESILEQAHLAATLAGLRAVSDGSSAGGTGDP